MTEHEIRDVAVRILRQIAPEADVQALEPGRRLRDQFDFDSVDFLNFALGLQAEFKLTIPETDYPRLATLESCIEYLSGRI